VLYAVALKIYGGRTSLFRPMLAQIFYVLNWTSLQSINFVTWTLEVEVQFYILAPLLGCLYLIRSATIRQALMVSLIAASIWVSLLPENRLSWNLPGQLQFFMVGFLLADLRAMRTESSIGNGWDLVGVAAWGGVFLLPPGYSQFFLPVMILCAFLAVFNGPVTRKIFRTEWIAITGGMCYSFYLMHMLVISTVFKLSRHIAVFTNFVVYSITQIIVLGTCIYLFCTAFYVCIERPCMDPEWPRKLLARQPEPDLVFEPSRIEN
jgi:peptidoglycan/LPS O-acetylase OafA/YrhL